VLSGILERRRTIVNSRGPPSSADPRNAAPNAQGRSGSLYDLYKQIDGSAMLSELAYLLA